jgi:hypothetical protein
MSANEAPSKTLLRPSNIPEKHGNKAYSLFRFGSSSLFFA